LGCIPSGGERGSLSQQPHYNLYIEDVHRTDFFLLIPELEGKG
jgi:hypothetical protein